MARFAQGEKVWVRSSGQGQYAVAAGDYKGIIFRQLSQSYDFFGRLEREWYAVYVYGALNPDGNYKWSVPHTDMRPRYDDYDGNQLTSWEDLPFQPVKEEA